MPSLTDAPVVGAAYSAPAACAHSRVQRATVTCSGGLSTEHWQCSDCAMQFAPTATVVDIRTILLRFIDTAGNKRDLVTPGQTCALLDLLNELHPEDRPDAR